MRFNPVAPAMPTWRMLKLVKWMTNIHQSMWDHEPLHLDKWCLEHWALLDVSKEDGLEDNPEEKVFVNATVPEARRKA
jgi:hypothetical protein